MVQRRVVHDFDDPEHPSICDCDHYDISALYRMAAKVQAEGLNGG